MYYRKISYKEFLKHQKDIPEPLYNYVKGLSEFTGIPVDELLKSEKVKKYFERYGYILD